MNKAINKFKDLVNTGSTMKVILLHSTVRSKIIQSTKPKTDAHPYQNLLGTMPIFGLSVIAFDLLDQDTCLSFRNETEAKDFMKHAENWFSVGYKIDQIIQFWNESKRDKGVI